MKRYRLYLNKNKNHFENKYDIKLKFYFKKKEKYMIFFYDIFFNKFKFYILKRKYSNIFFFKFMYSNYSYFFNFFFKYIYYIRLLNKKINKITTNFNYCSFEKKNIFNSNNLLFYFIKISRKNKINFIFFYTNKIFKNFKYIKIFFKFCKYNYISYSYINYIFFYINISNLISFYKINIFSFLSNFIINKNYVIKKKIHNLECV